MKTSGQGPEQGATAGGERRSLVAPTVAPAPREPLPALDGAVLLPIAKIRRWRQQPRGWIDEERLRELAASIRLHGILQPIRVRPDRRSHLPAGGYLITVGERRFLAAQLAGLTTVPAIIHDVAEEQALLDALTENLQRQDLTPDEENEAVRRLRERGLADSEIARRLGVSKSAISRLLAVFDDANLGPRVTAGRLTLTQARELLNLPRRDQTRVADFLAVRQRQGAPVGRTELRQLVVEALRPEGGSRAAPTIAGVRAGHAPAPALDPDEASLLRELSAMVDPVVPVPLDRAQEGARATPANTHPARPARLSPLPEPPVPAALPDARADRERRRARARALALCATVATELAILERHLADPAVRAALDELTLLLTIARARGEYPAPSGTAPG